MSPTESQTPLKEDHICQLRRLEITLWLIALLLGFFHVWASHHYLVNADAMSYLDIAEAYLRNDWSMAVNAYWSPLYSWLIALALLIAKPSPYWKFALLHLVNLGIYLFALACFGFLIRETIRAHRARRAELLTGGFVVLPDWAVLVIGYSLFIWSSLFLVTVQLESPDMLVAAFVYLATGMLVRIRRQPGNWLPFVLLGIVLGLGFLAKSVMLPLAPVFLITSLFSIGAVRRALPRVLVAIACFVLIAGPFVFLLSRAKGYPTAGQTGGLNYLWSINRVSNTHWQGEEPGSGTPIHPTRKIFDEPPAYEFAEPVGGTYPVWYDPTYWYEGSVSHFDFRRQLGVFVGGLQSYYQIFQEWGLQYGFLVAVILLYAMGCRPRLVIYDLSGQLSLLIPAFAGLGLYALVNVQGRYVAPFVVLLWLAMFAAVRLPHTPDSVRLLKAITLILAGSVMFTTIASSAGETTFTFRQLVAGEDPAAHEQWQVAEGLRELGLISNDKVAFLGNSRRAFWANLLGIQIVAEVRRDKVMSFWEADLNLKRQVIDAFARTGVKAIVAEKPPAGTELNGWQRIRQTDYYIYLLR